MWIDRRLWSTLRSALTVGGVGVSLVGGRGGRGVDLKISVDWYDCILDDGEGEEYLEWIDLNIFEPNPGCKEIEIDSEGEQYLEGIYWFEYIWAKSRVQLTARANIICEMLI